MLFLGVLYHLFDPIDGLRRAASLATEVLVVETHVDARHFDRPAMIFYPGTELGDDATNWWGPNVPLLRALLTTLGFTRIDVQVPPGTRAIVHAWRSDRLRNPQWSPPATAPMRSRRNALLERVVRFGTQRIVLE